MNLLLKTKQQQQQQKPKGSQVKTARKQAMLWLPLGSFKDEGTRKNTSYY